MHEKKYTKFKNEILIFYNERLSQLFQKNKQIKIICNINSGKKKENIQKWRLNK